MENGDAWEILKRRVHEIEIIAHSADAGVRMETRNDRIAQLLSRKHQRYGRETTG
jgi:hypothetical protein